MGISKVAVKRPVTTFMVILIAVAFGFLSISNLRLDMMPNMNIPVAIVSTDYKGTAPSEIETLITIPLEGALGTVAGIKNVTSTSSNGNSLIILEFEDGTDIDNASLDVRERIDLIKGMLPEGAGDPIVMKIDMNSMSSMMIGVSGSKYDLVDLKRVVDDKISNRFERQDGVASVSISGGKEKEITVTLSPEKLRGYGISESQVMQLIMSENRNTPAGTVKQGDKSLQLRVVGEFATIDELRMLPLTLQSGATIFLNDIAEVEEVFKEPDSLSYINGVPSVTISIQKQSTANTVNVANAVLQEMNAIQSEMPELEFKVILNPADFVTMTLSTVASSAIFGGVLAVVILFIFLRDFRSTLIVAASMPISIVTTFVLMYYADITLNVMSLGGLALGIGMLVDNSIVVLESIYRKIEEGENKIDAAINGAREVALSVTASTLTTVAVFLPITFGGGLTAQIFNQLALTIAFSLASSLVVSLTFVPMASSLILRPIEVTQAKRKKTILSLPLDIFSNFISWLEKAYTRVLAVAIEKRKRTLAIVGLFIAVTLVSLQFVEMEFMPTTDESGVAVNITMPKGALLSQTEAITEKALEKISTFEEITDITYTIGSQSTGSFGEKRTDQATIDIKLVDKNERKRSSAEVAIAMSDALKDVAGAEFSCSASGSSMGQFAGGNSIDIFVKGSDLETLEGIANDVKGIISNIQGTRDVKTSVESVSPQAVISVDRNKASSYGLSASSVSSIINTAITGTVATTYKIDGDEIDIRIMQNKDDFNYINDVNNILIPTPTGVSIPLYELAEIEIKELPTSITRENQQRYISITGSLVGRASGSVDSEIREAMKDYNMPSGYSWGVSGQSQQMAETFGGLGVALVIAVFLVYMIMAAEFESLIYPFIVMFSIPVAMTGALLGLWVFGATLNITSFLGLIMLAGIVINNAIVLIDYTNLLIRERGMSAKEAVLAAGPVRLRPILMSVLTTVLGLAPLMFSTGQGSELMLGLATVVVSGLLLSTLVTLLLIPTIYIIVDNTRQRFRKKA